MSTIPKPFALLSMALFLSACRRDMQDQPKFKPLQASRFYSDGRSARPTPAGTIAVDELDVNDTSHTGITQGGWSESIPIAVDAAFLHRGQDRYDIYCSPCHSRLGDGNGMVAQRGVRWPASFHTDRLRRVPPGYLFDVISNGFGGMGEYKDQIPVRDRWAIVAYVRALQLSRNATVADVPANALAQLETHP